MGLKGISMGQKGPADVFQLPSRGLCSTAKPTVSRESTVTAAIDMTSSLDKHQFLNIDVSTSAEATSFMHDSLLITLQPFRSNRSFEERIRERDDSTGFSAVFLALGGSVLGG